MSFVQLMAARYSVRKFRDTPVEKEKMDQILAAARNAPTAGNRQPQRIAVLEKPEDLAKMDRCTTSRFGAPLAFLICYDKNAAVTREDGKQDPGWGSASIAGMVDASIATTQMMYQAQDLGLGTTWVMWFDPFKARSEFNIPDNFVPVAFLPTGYAAPDAAPSDQHLNRFPLDKLVCYGSF
jgi:nitroreductase